MVPYSTRCLIFINRFWFFGGITHGAAIPAPCGTWGSPRHVFGFLALGSGCFVFFLFTQRFVRGCGQHLAQPWLFVVRVRSGQGGFAAHGVPWALAVVC